MSLTVEARLAVILVLDGEERFERCPQHPLRVGDHHLDRDGAVATAHLLARLAAVLQHDEKDLSCSLPPAPYRFSISTGSTCSPSSKPNTRE